MAARFLKKRGLKILARNYRCPPGEADVIAMDASTRAVCGAETLVFVEVKTRRSDAYTDPRWAVDAGKRDRMRKVAKYFTSARGAGEFNVRFDIVTIVAPDGDEPEITYIPDAF